MSTKCVFLERKVGQYQISLYLPPTNDCFSATIQNSSGSIVYIDPSHIKCGILGTTPHPTFIQKVNQLAREKLAAFAYPSEDQPTELWIFEATPLSAPLIKTTKESLKQNNPEKALKQLETALKLEQ